jgi:hypothetical protein
VYLDADTLALQNCDDLFLCDGLCAAMRHSERFNTGVLVLRPSAALFAEMMDRIQTTPSYTGGDQGFLNSFFPAFKEAPFFDPQQGGALSAGDTQRTQHGVPVSRGRRGMGGGGSRSPACRR